MLSLLVLALGLAMDATAAAAAKGFAAREVRLRDAAAVALLFGGFQAGMPAIGFALGARGAPFVAAWDHWLAFGLLTALGVKVLVEALRGGPRDTGGASPFDWRGLVGLAFATSIDALAAGLTLPMLGTGVVVAVATIGAVTAALSFGGVYAGRRLGRHVGKKLDVVGGLMLVGIGTKILLEHLGAEN